METAKGDKTAAASQTPLKERYDAVRQRVADAAERSGRKADDIVLVAVTKYAAMDEVRDLIRMGHLDFGESRVQNLIQRAAQVEEFLQRKSLANESSLPDEVRWHMIGHLQRNKVRRVLDLVRLIHSTDSLRLAEEVQAAADKRDEPVEVLIQVNTSGESRKFGIAPAATRHLLDQMDTMLSIRPRGLMCMAPLVENPTDARPTFDRCKELFDDLRRSGIVDERFNILSMGMSNDFEVGIECGANVVRVGTAIFGRHEEPE